MQEFRKRSLVHITKVKGANGMWASGSPGQCWTDVETGWGFGRGAECTVELQREGRDAKIRVLDIYRAPAKTPGAYVTVVPEIVAEEIAA